MHIGGSAPVVVALGVEAKTTLAALRDLGGKRGKIRPKGEAAKPE